MLISNIDIWVDNQLTRALAFQPFGFVLLFLGTPGGESFISFNVLLFLKLSSCILSLLSQFLYSFVCVHIWAPHMLILGREIVLGSLNNFCLFRWMSLSLLASSCTLKLLSRFLIILLHRLTSALWRQFSDLIEVHSIRRILAIWRTKFCRWLTN